MDIFRTLIVQANQVELAREVGASYGAGGEGMFVTPLSSTGQYPATHYISSGLIPVELDALLATIPDIDISDDDAFTAMARLGLQIVNVEVSE